MGLKLFSIGSSSSGNSYLIQSEGTALLLDAGLSGKAIRAGISEAGLSTSDIQGILLTHEHCDHDKSAHVIAKHCADASVYASGGTIRSSASLGKLPDERLEVVQKGQTFDIGDIRVKVFALSHDASEPVSYMFTSGSDTLAVVTDSGIVTEEIYGEMLAANKLVFESNHEEDLLMFGPYPYQLKRRILSYIGHLSNKTSGTVLARYLEDKAQEEAMVKIMLAHLSPTNNTPSQAEWTVGDILSSRGFEKNRDYSMNIALKEGLTLLE